MKRHRRSVVPPAKLCEDVKRRKYDLEPKLDQPPELCDEDAKRLRTLLRNYGRDQISQVALTIDVCPKRGRPPRGELPKYERIHFAQWIEEEAEERRKAGSKSPIKDAFYAAFEMDVDELKKEERRDPGHFNRWLKTHKKKWHQGNRNLEGLRERQKLYDRMRKARKQTQKKWPDE